MMTQNSHTALSELQPVDLDPPVPEIVRWQKLAELDHTVEHKGDASKVIPFDRPAWADPTEDVVSESLSHTRYRSTPAEVVTGFAKGLEDGTYVEPATARVQALHFGDGTLVVHLALRSLKNDEWFVRGVNLAPAEAVKLAELLCSAVDLIGGV